MNTRYCPRCETEKPLSDFYKKRSGRSVTCYCKVCLLDQYKQRHREFKRKCVEYKGGKCQVCGYDKCLTALEFHHTDPSKKDFELSRRRQRSDWVEIFAELDKTILLCCRCHREVHDGLLSVPSGNRTRNQ